ncbi:MAG: FAD binding domain-containing protein, partial [Chitinophagaceae bacterium]
MLYFLPTSISDAVNLISHGAVPLAGGTVLVKKILEFKSIPGKIADLRLLKELKGINVVNDHLEIGAMTPLSEILESPLLTAGEFSAFGKAVHSIGNPHIRQMGTVGGNILLHSPLADLRPVFLSFNGQALLLYPDEKNKWVPVEDLWSSS